MPKRVWLLGGSEGISGKILNLDPLRLRLTQSETNFPNNTYYHTQFQDFWLGGILAGGEFQGPHPSVWNTDCYYLRVAAIPVLIQNKNFHWLHIVCSFLWLAPIILFESNNNLPHFQLVHHPVSQHLEKNWLLYLVYSQGEELFCTVAVAQLETQERCASVISQISSKTYTGFFVSCDSPSFNFSLSVCSLFHPGAFPYVYIRREWMALIAIAASNVPNSFKLSVIHTSGSWT